MNCLDSLVPLVLTNPSVISVFVICTTHVISWLSKCIHLIILEKYCEWKVSFQVHQSQSGWSPVFVTENLCLMSMGFLLPSPDHPVIWRGPRKNTLIRQFLTDVAWTEEESNLDQGTNLDFLIIDTPPGTSDEHLSVVQYLQAAECLDGAIIITTPQEVSLCDVRKVGFCPLMWLFLFNVPITPPSCKKKYGYHKSVFEPNRVTNNTLLCHLLLSPLHFSCHCKSKKLFLPIFYFVYFITY